MMKNIFNSYRLPYVVFAIIIGTLISRLGTSIVIPYITILLVQLKHLPLYWGGIAIGVSYLSQAFWVSGSGKLFPGIEPFKLMKLAICIYAALFLVMSLISKFAYNQLLVGYGFIPSFFQQYGFKGAEAIFWLQSHYL